MSLWEGVLVETLEVAHWCGGQGLRGGCLAGFVLQNPQKEPGLEISTNPSTIPAAMANTSLALELAVKPMQRSPNSTSTQYNSGSGLLSRGLGTSFSEAGRESSTQPHQGLGIV